METETGGGDTETQNTGEDLICNKEDKCSLDGTPTCISYCYNPASNQREAELFKVQTQTEEYLTGNATFECLDSFYEPQSKVVQVIGILNSLLTLIL